MANFIDLIRLPDNVKLQAEDTPIRFEESGVNEADALDFKIEKNSLHIYLLPTDRKIKRIRLRFRGDMGGICSVFGDGVERCWDNELCWWAMTPERIIPWNFAATDGLTTHCYGAKTGCNSFVFWQCDRSGITLWLDVRNGVGGISPKEPLLCAEIICREGKEGEAPFFAYRDFCGKMCEKPNLPDTPVFGFNNWYWSYGVTDEATFLGEADDLGAICQGLPHRPFLVMDDGWQINHTGPNPRGAIFNGGPWDKSNERFPDMVKMAASVKEKGCRPGLWFRPLQTMSHVPFEASYLSPYEKKGFILDPSHPFSLEKISEDVSRIVSWGYELIKHDFTTLDLFGLHYREQMPQHFYDTTLTNAQIVKNLFRTIQDAARSALVIGCNTINHLAAGIHQIQRISGDTSGNNFEVTRRDGIHSMMRLPQNNRFFMIDPDCAAFTEKVSHEMNLDFMEAMAISGTTVFASVTPGILKEKDRARMADIFKLAATVKPEELAILADWHRTCTPSEFFFRGKNRIFDWYREYDGVRQFYTWTE